MMRPVPDEHVDSIMERLGIDTTDPNASDIRGLVEYVSELGFTHNDYVTARAAWSAHRTVIRGLQRKPD